MTDDLFFTGTTPPKAAPSVIEAHSARLIPLSSRTSTVPADNFDWERDNPKEECGIFGIYALMKRSPASASSACSRFSIEGRKAPALLSQTVAD